MVGVITAATVEPKHPQMPQMPMAVPILSGRTTCCTTMGPQVVSTVSATPSMARPVKNTTSLSPASQLMSVPAIMMTHEDTTMNLTPTLRITSAPTGANTTAAME